MPVEIPGIPMPVEIPGKPMVPPIVPPGRFIPGVVIPPIVVVVPVIFPINANIKIKPNLNKSNCIFHTISIDIE